VLSHGGFFVPELRPGDRLLDLGCGPASITVGLREAVCPGGSAVGVDLHPGPAALPLARADVGHLPFPDATFTAVFACAVLQHLARPADVLTEAARVCRPGAVIGVADADWGGALVVPEDTWLDRGLAIQERLRPGTSVRVGRHLRGLLHDAGFVDAAVTVRAHGGGGPDTAAVAERQAAIFEAPATVELAVAEGIATADEMAAVSTAWRRWGAHPSAVHTGYWFEAVARKPG
jgi:SAM-dependent methyltransferase